MKEQKSKGAKIHLAYRLETSLFPPPNTVDDKRNEGMLWCPYCRAWRWFTVPGFHSKAEVNEEDWFMNSFHRQGIRVCRWCHISEMDFYVCKANGIFGEVNGAKRRKRKRRVR